MQVLIAQQCGFCFGVERAIDLAEQLLAAGKRVYCLGSLIHNEQAVARLESAGLKVVEEVSEVPTADNGEVPTVLIRSHGCHPKVLEAVKERGLQLADATCVLVKRLQKLVSQCSEEGYQVVVIGDPDHPEVRAAQGYGKGVMVVANEADLAQLPQTGKLAVMSQTTHGAADFGRLVGLIAAKGYTEIKVVNTICRETSRRQEAAVELANEVDVMFVLGGRQSANTRELAELCRRQGMETYHLQDWGEFKPQYVEGTKIAGVTAGASTPRWIIEQFVDGLRAI
ncbi:MAG: 4-hydroxy-3-methylbut-2-enyl diphosphate reductase [Sedimentisphaerales bacterium]|nr:4-hydroxy-3-methylbut-2-enyl diphosphate reductase [Sedimentisphaerales bacterium]